MTSTKATFIQDMKTGKLRTELQTRYFELFAFRDGLCLFLEERWELNTATSRKHQQKSHPFLEAQKLSQKGYQSHTEVSAGKPTAGNVEVRLGCLRAAVMPVGWTYRALFWVG